MDDDGIYLGSKGRFVWFLLAFAFIAKAMKARIPCLGSLWSTSGYA